METEAVLAATAALAAIADPLAVLPVYLSSRRADDTERHRRDALHATAAVCICLGGSAVMGTRILDLFGVTVAGLRAAGGLLVTISAFSMVQGDMPSSDFSEDEAAVAKGRPDDALSIYVPLSIPMVAGPGAITSTITLTAREGVGLPGIAVAIAVTGAFTFLTFCFARAWYRLLGDFGLRLMTRLFGILVMAVGVQMVVAGVRELWNA